MTLSDTLKELPHVSEIPSIQKTEEYNRSIKTLSLMFEFIVETIKEGKSKREFHDPRLIKTLETFKSEIETKGYKINKTTLKDNYYFYTVSWGE